MDQLVDFITGFPDPWAYTMVFLILLACGFGLPIPEDITLFTAGYIAYVGGANVYLMIMVCFAGVMVGDGTIFYLGHRYGRKLTKKAFFNRILPKQRLDYVQQKLHRQGNKVVFFARFMPGMRAPIYFTAGTLHLPYRVFVTYDGIAALLSVPAIVFSVFYFGEEVDYVIHIIKRVQFGILGAILALIALIVGKWYLSRRKLNGGGRRSA